MVDLAFGLRPIFCVFWYRRRILEFISSVGPLDYREDAIGPQVPIRSKMVRRQPLEQRESTNYFSAVVLS